MDDLTPWRTVSARSPDFLLEWAISALPEIRGRLNEVGHCWIRTRSPLAPTLAQDLLSLVAPPLMEDLLWSTPRSRVSGKTFTATEYPSSETIPPHSEMAYLRRFPRLLCFHAVECAPVGGQTTVADLDEVSADLGELTMELLHRRIRYVRVFRPGVDIPLATAFGTDEPARVERIAAEHGMSVDKISDGVVRVTHEAQGALSDETSGLPVWFNQLHLFHPSRLKQSLRNGLISLFGVDGLPRQAFFEDGSPIPDKVVARVGGAFERNAQAIAWEPGDILLVDNLRHAHGRLPFTGRRVVHVAMGLPHESAVRVPLFPPG